MTYPETAKYLESFINYEKFPTCSYGESLQLDRISCFLDLIGNPQETLKSIHIAGTKGKGSTCAFISYILREAGFTVGLYTSPHLSNIRERIRILTPNSELRTPNNEFEGMISEDELSRLVERFKPVIDKYNESSKYGPLSFFEVYTSLALVYFKEKNVDFTVLETGLGGRLDATNVVNSYVCAIAPISYEHTQQLGNRLEEIAREKAGIIKDRPLRGGSASLRSRSSIVISAPQEREVKKVIRDRCKEVGARLYEVGQDITYQKANSGFSIKGVFGEYPDLKIKFLGKHQIINAAVSLGVVEALRNYGIDVNINVLRDGIYNTLWPGRCEVISDRPLVVLDGAMNIASSIVLKETINENFKYRRLILVLGISQDKDIKGMCSQLYDLADEVVLTQANNPRAAGPEALAGFFKGKLAHVAGNVAQAKALAYGIAKEDDLILVAGSLFVVGEFRE